MKTQSIGTIEFDSENFDQLPEGVKRDYSMMKFGCVDASRRIGKQMGKVLIGQIDITRPLVLTASPYSILPKSSKTLADETRRSIATIQQQKGVIPSIAHTTIRNDTVYDIDYGKLGMEDRMKLIGNDVLTFDREGALSGDKTLIIVDDLRMTGTLEKVVRANLLRRYTLPDNLTIVFYYYLMNKSAASMPHLENELNFWAIKSIDDFIKLVKKGVILNMRSIKYILDQSTESIEYFINSIPYEFLETLKGALIDSKCIEVPTYAKKVGFCLDQIDGKMRTYEGLSSVGYPQRLRGSGGHIM